MENLRFILLALVALLGVLLFQAWQTDHAGNPAPQAAQTSHQKPDNKQASKAADNKPAPRSGTDNGPNKQSGGSSSDLANQTQDKAKESVSEDELVHVVTPNYRIAINRQGGDLHKATLRKVPESSDGPDTPLTLIRPGATDFFRQRTRVLTEKASGSDAREFDSEQSTYRLDKSDNKLKVPFVWHGPNGRTINKTYVFRRDSYRVDLNTSVKNGSGSKWTVSNFVRFWRHGGSEDDSSWSSWFMPSKFSGVGYYAANDNQEFSFQKRGTAALANNPVDLTQSGGWTGVMERYFLAAAIPDDKTKARFFASSKPTDAAPDAFATGFRTAQVALASDQSTRFDTRLFVGPKLQDDLSSVAPGLDLTVDYGFMTLLARPIFHVLSFLHSIVGNWGVAIILLTLFIKLLFYKLSEKQYRAMARMRKFQPRMQQLKEQYGDDRQQLQAKMMEMYKKEGFNPLAGCWPMLVQAPVFIVLYWVLLESAEMRASPFLWIGDLSSPDPFFILPVIFAVTMFIQQRLTMTTAMDPIQQRMMQIMPIGLGVFFTFFPAGLVLYWCTNNTLSIAQQWYIYRKLDSEGLSHNASSS